MIRYSVLDQSIAAAGAEESAAIRNSMALARHCDGLGYHRYWVSEHHNHPTIMGSAPEILIAAIASQTNRIRVGSAGVMLPHYAPYKVAEQFRILESIAPGRIDLGLGRAPGTDRRTAFALNPMADQAHTHFPSDVQDLQAWLTDSPLRNGHPFAGLRAHPRSDSSPEIWMLGSSNYGAELAAHLGLPYCFAWFFVDGQGAAEALRLYQDNYRPSERHPEPCASICLWALAADSEEEARFQLAPRIKWRILRDRGQYAPIDPPEVAEACDYSPAEAQRADYFRRTALVGTAPQVARQVEELARELKVQEVAIVAWTHDEQVRHHSYSLLAEQWQLA